MTSDGNDRLVVIEGIRAVHDSLFEHQDRVKFVLHTPNPFYSFMLSVGGTSGGSAMDGEHTTNDENAADKELIIDDNKVESTSSTSRHQILELLMDKLYGPIGGPLFRNKVFRIDSNIFQDISDTVNGQGVIAVIERPMFCLKNVLGSNDNNKLSAPVVVILDRISDPGNLGSLIRSSYGLGVDGILAIDCCDAWSSKVTRSAMAMNLRIPLIEMRSEEVVDAIRSLPMPNQAQCQVVVADGSHSNSKNYFDLDYQLLSRNDGAISEGTRSPSSSSPLFVFIGSEAHGVAPGLHGLLQWMEPQRVHYVKIPMMRAVESFNAAVAGSIILSEVSKQLQK
jgi:TrmH family RNA methyltransferase